MGTKIYHRLKNFVKTQRASVKPNESWRLEMPNTLLYSRRKRVLIRELKRRINNKSFDKLAALYGQKLPKVGLGRRLNALKQLAAEHWDFRKGKLRYEVDLETVKPGESVIDLNNPKIQQTIEKAAAGFGLTAPSKAGRNSYNGLIVPGGAGLSPYLRLKHALDQIGPNGQPVKFGWIALLGCDRVVKKDERNIAKVYAPKAKTEFDLMVAAAEKLLKPKLLRDVNMRRVGYAYDRQTRPHISYYKDINGTLILVFNAPIPAGQVKANTGRTYDFLRAASGKRLSRDKYVLLSSTARHRAFQHVDAERLLCLPTGISLETIGFSKNYSVNGLDPNIPPVQPPKEILQEIKSYIDALVKLKNATALGKRDKGIVSQV